MLNQKKHQAAFNYILVTVFQISAIISTLNNIQLMPFEL